MTHPPAKATLFHRLLVVYLSLLVWFVGIGARLIYLQAFQGPVFRQMARKQQTGFIKVHSRRGAILDRNLVELAVSVRADTVSAEPGRVKNPEEAASLLAPILNLSRETLLRRFQSRARGVYLKRRVSPTLTREVERLELEGIYVEPEVKRVYLKQGLAAHVIGFVGDEGRGLSGLEFAFDDELRAENTTVNVTLDARRNRVERQQASGVTGGNLLVLTLDSSLQHLAEQVLADTVAETGAVGAAALLMDPDSGEMLAMASWPTFNPNHFGDYSPDERRNRAILQNYEPGSTFKLITLASVLNEGLSDLDEVIDCRPGTARLGRKVYREAKHSFEDLTFTEILAKSSNIGTIHLGLRLGEETLYDYIRRFGFGSKTGVELPGEEMGLLRPPSQWSKLSIGALSIGQEIAVTPLQMVRATAVFANGGYLVQPHIVRRILGPDGGLIRDLSSGQERRRVLPDSTIDKLTKALKTVVVDGTGAAARLNGYSVAGKTGTAQKFINGHYSHDRFIASFLGFAPLSDPALVALVVIDEPQGAYYGGQVAAPAFREIMERSLIHLRVPRDLPVSSAGDRMADQRQPVEHNGPPDVSVGDNRPLLQSGPDPAVLSILSEARPESGGIVTLELDTLTLPDFAGMSLREVAEASGELGFRVRFVGQGVAVSQRPPAGREVMKNTVCEVFFSTRGALETAGITQQQH